MTAARSLILAAALLAIASMVWLAQHYGPDPLIDALLILEQWIEQHRVRAMLLHILAFVILATLSLPVGALLCVSAGYLFGLGAGAGIAWLGALLAAVITFLMARALLQPPLTLSWLPDRISRACHRVLQELEQHAAWYLMLLRIVPAAPFFVVNAAAGASATLSLKHYALWSGLGLLPSCVIYAWVGAEVGELIQLEDALSPKHWLEPKVAAPMAVLVALLLLSRFVKSQRWRRSAA